MRRLVLLLALVLVVFAGGAAFDWWIDPFGEVFKPGVLAAADRQGCLVSEELIGSRYWSFKRWVFFHRPTRTFVVGSSRVLKLRARPGESTFSNLGYPGTAPETILRLFRSLPATPRQTVYIGVEAFWFNRGYALPETDLSWNRELEYLLSRRTFARSVSLSRQSSALPWHRYAVSTLGGQCVLGRFSLAITWRLDGSRVWGWELDPKTYPVFGSGTFDGNLHAWRNGYYADWSRLDERRIEVLRSALALAKQRGWTVIGFPPPEPAPMLRILETDPRVAPAFDAWRRLMPRLFAEYGFRWVNIVDGAKLGCTRADFPDLFHSDAHCALRIRAALTSGR